MNFEELFLIWDQLNAAQKERMQGGLMTRQVKKGTILHNGSMDCTGLFLTQSGQLRAYILSDEGREITILDVVSRPPPPRAQRSGVGNFFADRSVIMGLQESQSYQRFAGHRQEVLFCSIYYC